MIRPAELIERKRDGEELRAEETDRARARLRARRGAGLPDGRLLHGGLLPRALSGAETFALTDAMIRSGETIELGAALGRKVVDKHSTGGVGDKTSLAVGPIVAACGVPFGKMSGRGLGHTGGTLDKLESIPGFRVELSLDEFVAQVREVGLAIVGQTGELVPADKKLYALRDVTATVDQVSLIAASIMSKKLAGGADAIVLDVKVGDGAFMKTIEDARMLAETMIEIGRRAGREVVCLLTDMDQPLGAAVGNALEVREALETVRGQGPPDFTELVLDACARLLALSDLGIDEAEGRRRAEAAVADGSADGALAALDRGAGRRSRRGRAPARAGRRDGGGSAGGQRRRHWARSASATQPSTSAPAGARRTTRSTTLSASSACASAATRRAGRAARGGARPRRAVGRGGGGRGARGIRSRGRVRARAAGAARGPALAAGLTDPATVRGCPSFPRSRRFAVSLRRCSKVAGSTASRSRTAA